MAFTSSTPLVHTDGKTYPYYGVSLITSPGFQDNTIDARVVLKLEPYRINEQGQIERPMVEVEVEGGGTISIVDDSLNKTVVFGNAYAQAASDPALATALTRIGIGLQEFILARGW